MTWDRIEPERIVEPSRIRRGRMATSPVWYVTTPDGDVWRFATRKDARAFIAARGCARHVDGSLLCPRCKSRGAQ